MLLKYVLYCTLYGKDLSKVLTTLYVKFIVLFFCVTLYWISVIFMMAILGYWDIYVGIHMYLQVKLLESSISQVTVLYIIMLEVVF